MPRITAATRSSSAMAAARGCIRSPACRLQAVVDRAGAPFVFDLQNLRDHGTGVGCSDLGNGTVATIGPSDTVTATSAQDPAVTSAQTISCGDLTIGQDGVQQP